MRNSIQLSTIATRTTLLLLLIVNTFHSCDAFVINNHNHHNNHIHNSKVVVTTTLYAESIEGWKINGIIKPVNNFILIEKEKEQSESDGGILLSKSVSFIMQNKNKYNIISFIIFFFLSYVTLYYYFIIDIILISLLYSK